jgi:1,4-dihydroxy-6-naphthoate synthase
MKLSIGFSPCPNDTFIFDALVNQKIDTGGLVFEPVLEDVQSLNEAALSERLLITKISYGVLPLVMDRYKVLNSGGALGQGVGPLLIGREPIDSQSVATKKIAIPGENTTAHMLFSLAYPAAKNKQFMVFSHIEDAVQTGKTDLGVIIHENRFTYAQKGLVKITDLGEYWEQQTNNPIPLGCIVIHKTIEHALQQKIQSLIKESVEFAFRYYPQLPAFIEEHAQEMSTGVMRQHIELYVNEYSKDLGPKGKSAVYKLLEVYQQLHENTESKPPADLFVE